MRVSLGPKYRDAAAIARYYDSAVDRVRDVPGVIAAAAISQLPLSGAQLGSTILASGERAAGDDVRVDVDLRGITADYPAAMRIPVLAGRGLTDADTATAPPVALVDETLAKRLSATGPVIGRRIRWIRRLDRPIEIVGILGAVRHRGVEDTPRETVYLPHTQYTRSTMFVIARTASAAEALVDARAVAAAVQQADPEQPIAELRTLDDLRARSLARPGFGAALGGLLAALALGMTSVGVFGLCAFAVAQRRRELGIRLALGATPREVLRMILSEAGAVATAGTAAGLAGGVAAARVTHAALPGPFAPEPAVLAVAGAVTFAAAVTACWLPARRAAAVDPADVLRADG
jgi:putative ABC transport system permease protein